VAVGQLVMGGREHIVAIAALERGLLLEILRYPHEVRSAEEFFDKIEAKPSREAVKIAAELIGREVGPFEPETMPNEYVRAVHELVRAKIEQRAPQVRVTEEPKAAPIINIMDALKKSMQAKARAKVREAVRRRMGDKAPKERATISSRQSKPRPTRRVH
jgi:DNA end-binding protein Ku